ncbi:MAG: sigma-70 family RNA polymerase sigma factor, partial [Alphaproteobacteria bacterium]|nr:sigma-70 family RNA polymerase sigma factor [Alphaproteobacteria bacterium]
RWRPALMSFFRRRVKDPCEAEDLTQDVFLRVLATGKPVERLDAYIFQIASNLLADRARRLAVRRRHQTAVRHDSLTAIDPIDPLRVTVARGEVAAVGDALRQLPERTRAMFLLYRIDQLPQDAIGELMGISASAVKQHVARAMGHLSATVRHLA